MKPFKSNSFVLLFTTSLTWQSASGATVLGVNWGGNYVDSTQLFADHDPLNASGSDHYGDPDGLFFFNTGQDGIEDNITGRSYSSTRPFSPNPGPQPGTLYAGTSATFYGGGSVTNENPDPLDENDGFTELSGINQGPNDSIHYHVDTGGDSHTFHLLLLWDKADFLNGLDAAPTVGLSEGQFALTTSQSSGHQTDELLRWVVRDGSQLYVSEGTVTISNNSTFITAFSALTNWAMYNPEDINPSGAGTLSSLLSLDFDENGPYNPHVFSDVTAVGFYVEHEQATGPVNVHIEGFSALFGPISIPEPALPTLFGITFLFGSMVRRRSANV